MMQRKKRKEQLLEIQELSQDIDEMCSNYVEHLYDESPVVTKDEGVITINTLPTSALPIKVADGWRIQSEELGTEQDVFLCHAKKGYELPKHVHLQAEYIEVIEGKILVCSRGNKFLLEEGQTLQINSYVPHSCCAKGGDAVLRVTFIPPITRKLEKYATNKPKEILD